MRRSRMCRRCRAGAGFDSGGAPSTAPEVSMVRRRDNPRRAGVSLGRTDWPGLGAGRGRRRVDDARQGLFLDPVQQARRDHAGQRDAPAPRVDVLHRGPGGSPGAAAGGQQHDVRGHPVAQRALCVRPHPGGLSAQVEVPAGREPERDRGRPAATWSTGARSTPTARSSTTCSTGTRSRWMRSRARSCGRRRSPMSQRARPRRWRRSWSRTGSSSAPRAASSASTAGSRGSISRPARWSGPGATSAPTPRCWPSPARSSRSMTRAPTWGSRAGRRMRTRSAARRCGAGCRTTPSWTWCTTASATRRPTTPNSGSATTSGPGASSRAGPPTGRWSGRTSSRPTTTGTTTPSPP